MQGNTKLGSTMISLCLLGTDPNAQGVIANIKASRWRLMNFQTQLYQTARPLLLKFVVVVLLYIFSAC
jgi:hypothetical protein